MRHRTSLKALAFVPVAVCLSISSAAPAPTPPSSADAHWPQWRGPFATGMARGDAPVRWSKTQNIRWKLQIPGRGHSTPVIWGDRIFLTTAVPIGTPPPKPAEQTAPEGQGRGRPMGNAGPQQEHRFDVYCIDRKTGAVVWQRTAKTAIPHEGFHSTYGSFASNSPVTDGERVYAFFGSRGIYCYDFKGKLLWQNDPGVQLKMRLQFGEGTAPVLEGDRLVVTFDHEVSSFIVALDKKTGKEIWRTPRDEGSNWSTPLVVDYGGQKQVVVSATKKVRSYDLGTGKLIWECAGLGANTIPAPVHQSGVVFVMSGFRNPNLLAIRLGREGDLTGSDAILWTRNRGLSYTPSPVLFENKLYLLTDNGMISCLNATTGEPYYQLQRLPKPYNFKASPVGANGKLYLASEDGDVVVLKMGEKYEVIATNTMEDEFFVATPVIADDEMFLRGKNTLYCVSEKKR
ncbi:MAG TPA: PQQ-binding-like beta-propeller repeat protein [Blastocatellia bacterium]|nr:PQQ-binding-like beta-propeller repeat protein [Blastocatellia bacterium]